MIRHLKCPRRPCGNPVIWWNGEDTRSDQHMHVFDTTPTVPQQWSTGVPVLMTSSCLIFAFWANHRKGWFMSCTDAPILHLTKSCLDIILFQNLMAENQTFWMLRSPASLVLKEESGNRSDDRTVSEIGAGPQPREPSFDALPPILRAPYDYLTTADINSGI